MIKSPEIAASLTPCHWCAGTPKVERDFNAPDRFRWVAYCPDCLDDDSQVWRGASCTEAAGEWNTGQDHAREDEIEADIEAKHGRFRA